MAVTLQPEIALIVPRGTGEVSISEKDFLIGYMRRRRLIDSRNVHGQHHGKESPMAQFREIKRVDHRLLSTSQNKNHS